jgi:hypothetical protein
MSDHLRRKSDIGCRLALDEHDRVSIRPLQVVEDAHAKAAPSTIV